MANHVVHDYLIHLRQRGLASATVNRRLSALRSLVRLARLFPTGELDLELPGEKLERYRETREWQFSATTLTAVFAIYALIHLVTLLLGHCRTMWAVDP